VLAVAATNPAFVVVVPPTLLRVEAIAVVDDGESAKVTPRAPVTAVASVPLPVAVRVVVSATVLSTRNQATVPFTKSVPASVTDVSVPALVEVRVSVRVAEPVRVITIDSPEPIGELRVALMIAPGVPAASAAGLPEALVKVTVVGDVPVEIAKAVERSAVLAV
jgi:hypothetical protein